VARARADKAEQWLVVHVAGSGGAPNAVCLTIVRTRKSNGLGLLVDGLGQVGAACQRHRN